MNELSKGCQLQNGKYIVERKLGSGGFGITYLAKTQQHVKGKLGDIVTTATVCLKEFFTKDLCVRHGQNVVCTGSTDDFAMLRNKFRKEAESIATFKHPHIIQVADVFDENGTTYYVMQYLEGGSLSQLVEQQGPLDQQTATVYVCQVAEALQYLHEKKHFCHLDVKPSNIMLDSKGQAQLIDFGISKHYHVKNNKETTDTPVGISPGFAPEEQYDGQLYEFSPETDIYSLAATLYYLLTGQKPPTAIQISQQPYNFTRPKTVSPSVWAVIAKGMSPQKEMRYHTAKTFAEALRPAVTKTGKKKEDKPNGQNNPPLWKKVLLVVSALSAIVLGALLAKFLFGEDKGKNEEKPPEITYVTDRVFPDETGMDQFIYTGPVENGKPHGKGTARSVNGWVYEGPFVNGKREGDNARLTYNNKNVFRGGVIDKYRQVGVVTTPDGRRFEGELHQWTPYLGYWYEKGSNKPYVRILYGREVAP